MRALFFLLVGLDDLVALAALVVLAVLVYLVHLVYQNNRPMPCIERLLLSRL